MRPTRIQISLHICAVWLESSLGAFWIARDAKFLHAENEDFDQPVRMRRLIWVCVLRRSQKVRFLTLRLLPHHQAAKTTYKSWFSLLLYTSSGLFVPVYFQQQGFWLVLTHLLANSVDPDQLASEPTDLDLHCLSLNMWISIKTQIK